MIILQTDDFVILELTRGGFDLTSVDYGFQGTFDDKEKALKAFKQWKEKMKVETQLWYCKSDPKDTQLHPIDENGTPCQWDVQQV